MEATVVSSWNDFDPLKHAIVGRADFTCIPPSEPATEAKVPEDSDMRGMWGPRPLATVERANAQLDHLVSLLESRGVRVDRPEPIQWNQGEYAGLHDWLDVWLYAAPRCPVNSRQGNP